LLFSARLKWFPAAGQKRTGKSEITRKAGADEAVKRTSDRKTDELEARSIGFARFTSKRCPNALVKTIKKEEASPCRFAPSWTPMFS
jgi:hypothetical protein